MNIYGNEIYFCLLWEKKSRRIFHLYKYLRNCLLCEKFLKVSQCPLGLWSVSMHQHPGGALPGGNSRMLPVMISAMILNVTWAATLLL